MYTNIYTKIYATLGQPIAVIFSSQSLMIATINFRDIHFRFLLHRPYPEILAKHQSSAGFPSPSRGAVPPAPIWETAVFSGDKKKIRAPPPRLSGGACGAPNGFKNVTRSMKIPNMCLVLKLDNGKVVSIANGQNHRQTDRHTDRQLTNRQLKNHCKTDKR